VENSEVSIFKTMMQASVPPSLRVALRAAAPAWAHDLYYGHEHRTPYRPFNDAYHCIFVHVPKVAGLSVICGLFGLAEVDVDGRPGHRTAREFRRYDRERFRRYFKFAFVRDPCDRFASAYRFLKRGGINAEDGAFAAAVLAGYHDLGDFVDRLALDGALRRRALAYHHFRPQTHFLCDRRGRVMVDFVGRFENLQRDYRLVCEALGVDRPLACVNRTPGAGGGTRALSDRQRVVIRRLYRSDFATFGYREA
jgi:chondroitin 4-sulfotransferase 11